MKKGLTNLSAHNLAMNYPEDNYDQVHDQIVDNLRQDYERWVEVEKENKDDANKRELARSKQRKLIKIASKYA